MKKEQIKLIFSIGILALIILSNGCRIAEDRPILEVPDGNKDRMLKENFSGSEKEPKYWIYKVTVVNTSFGTEGLGFVFEGLQSEAKAGYFEFTRDKLKFNNIITRQFLEKPEVASQGAHELINEWSINHSQFRLAEVDGYTTNREEENNYIEWHKKSHFTVDWSKADISEANTFPYTSYSQNIKCWNKKTAYVIDSSRDITFDYISFTIAVEYEQNPMCAKNESWVKGNFTTTVHYKYSFKKIPDPRLKDAQNYTPYVYTGEQDPLLKKYGYFQTVRPAIAEEDNRDKNIFYMNRWNPNKKHIFYFSKDYPKEYKDIAHGVICHTNKLFAKHKLNNYPLNGKCKEDGSVLPAEQETCSTGICFELRKNTGQEFGDIRYSFFHLLKTDMPILGYGPSDAHPATGEIISGNVVISTYYLNFYLKYFIHEFYKRDNKEYYDDQGKPVANNKNFKHENSSLFIKMKNTLKEQNHTLWTHTSKLIDKDSEIRPEFEYLLSQLTFGHPDYSWFTNSTQASAKSANNDFYLDFPFLPPAIPKQRIEDMQDVIKQSERHLGKKLGHQRNTTIYPAEPVIAQLPSLLANGITPDEIKKRILFNLASHEFLHVLNMRHNFYGSVDARHWHTHDDNTPVLKTSSIMDYMHLKDEAAGPLSAVFGPYDEAALVYAYSGGVKDLSKEKNTQYLFCTDHHLPLNSLCNAWDRGSTPSEVTMSLIENYEEMYFIRNLRLNRAYWDTTNYPVRIFHTMWNMKRTLMMWRTAFRDDYISKALDQSIKNYTAEDVEFISHPSAKRYTAGNQTQYSFLQLRSSTVCCRQKLEKPLQ